MIILDASGSVGYDNFQTSKLFVADVISNFKIGASDTRVGVATFSTYVTNHIPLGSILEKETLNTTVESILYDSGWTATYLALNFMIQEFNIRGRINQGIPRVAVLITDGLSNDPSSTAIAAEALHAENNIAVYSFGVANANDAELNLIASSSSNVYHIDNFDPESFESELRPLQLSACISKNNVFVLVKKHSL